MKLFIDSGNLKEIEALVPLGIIDGITTNPSLLAKEGGDYKAILKKICQIVKGPTSAEVVATDADGMIREGRELAAIDEHIVVKVPFTKDGVKACKALSSEGKRVNVTLVFSPTQALIAAKVGAYLRQPVRRPARRHRDVRHGADQRDRRHLRELPVHDRDSRRVASAIPSTSSKPRAWAPTSAPVPRPSSNGMFRHPLTDIGLEKFLKDWEKAQAVKA